MYNDTKDDDREIPQKAVLVCIQSEDMEKNEAATHLAELASLVETMGAETLDSVIVPLKKKNPKFLVGSGKAQELSDIADNLDADLIIFDDEISPAQQRNLEELSGKCVIDRHEVILDIFAGRATTKEAVLQVGLARMKYSLPRLTRAWTHLSRQKGGSKGTRGEGETQLEVDRRIVLRKIDSLKEELKKIAHHRETMRKQRSSLTIPTGAIVGYTNAGKSSLLNSLADSDAFVENKLFATLDPITRKISLPGGKKVLLTDTVGFIRKLPHDLVDAFKSTLEETVLSDFLIHVLDLSNPYVEEHYRITMEVLEELGADGKPMIVLFNKADLVHDNMNIANMENKHPDALFISTKTGSGLDTVIGKIEELLDMDKQQITVSIPADRYDLVSMIHREGTVLSEEYKDNGLIVKARVPGKLYNKLSTYLLEE